MLDHVSRDNLFEKGVFPLCPTEWEEASLVKNNVRHILSIGDNMCKGTGAGKYWPWEVTMADT